MTILGITAPTSWNTAAALLKDGQLVAAAEEERFTRVKHAPNAPPVLAAAYCLKAAGIRLEEVDVIAVGWRDVASCVGVTLLEELRSGRFLSAAAGFLSGVEYATRLYRLRHTFAHQLGDLRRIRWMFVPHHLAHAASAYYCSGWSEASIVSLDGNGENDSGLLGVGRGTRIERLETIRPSQSLGVLYGTVTELLGFRRHSQEGKTMGLAAWGQPAFRLDPDATVNGTAYRLRRECTRRLVRRFGPRRLPTQPLGDRHRNLAHATQAFLEQAGVSVVRRVLQRTGQRQICLAGGVALNCDMNARILAEPGVEDLFVQPAAHDGGVSLGAALIATAAMGEPHMAAMTHASWGPGYSDAEIETVLKEVKAAYTRCSDIAEAAADLLAKGKIVGWFQGRMEWGPRALGNRSILAHPGLPQMKDAVNLQVKHRESWRPFAPSLLDSAGPDLVEGYRHSPFMLVTFKVKPTRARDLAAATHVDGTVRIQSVAPDASPLYHRLIERFAAKTGIPAVLNTSFNDEGEPLVMSPRDALRTFSSTGLDALAIGSYLLVK